MQFQIKNKEGNPIPINDLDKEAAQFWNKSVHPTQYAFPYTYPENGSFQECIAASWMPANNWYDMIGFNIASRKATTWEELRHELLRNTFDGEMNPVLQPHFDLIDLWESKGYTPYGF